MTYVVLHVPSDKPPPHHSAPDLPEEDKRVIAGLCGGNPTVEISLGTTHVYRRTDKMGCMPPKVPQPAATTALAVMTYGYVSLVQFARFVAKECTGRVFRVVYFRGPSYSHLFFIDAHRIAVAEELHSKFSGAPIGDDTAAVAVSFPLLSSYFDKMPICWADADTDSADESRPLDAPPTPLTHTVADPDSPPIIPSLRVRDYTELPPCPSCLERLDASISGVRHLMCRHSNNCDCHFRNDCGICRTWRTVLATHSTNSPLTPCPGPLNPLAASSDTDVPHCRSCHRLDSLWVCLVCGFIGCGRYTEQHTLKHCQATGHSIVMELASQKVWDYECDIFVHRLLVHKGEKDLLPDQWDHEKREQVAGKEIVNAKLETKQELICMEYSQLLQHQMESARHYHEERLRAMDEVNAAVVAEAESRLQSLDAELVAAVEKGAAAVEEHNKAQRELDKERGGCAALEVEGEVLKKERAALEEEQASLKAEIARLLEDRKSTAQREKDELADLRAQVHDLEVAVGMRKKCEGMSAKDLAASFTVVAENARPKRGRKR